MQERDFLLAIHLTSGIGRVRESKIRTAIIEGRVARIYPWTISDLGFALEEDLGQPKYANLVGSYEENIQVVEARDASTPFISYFDQEYPAHLREIFQPPLVLFYRGDLRALQLPTISIVGTRTATPYGLAVLRAIVPELVRNGVSIVSGLARGIDSMAHQITFSAGGVPIGVIGSGLGISYPNQNRRLQQQVSQQGLLLSEYPEKMRADKAHFPERNRIIAGLSGLTLIVEAKKRSGSLITANVALQNNREVMAVPGSVFSPESAGCHELIAAGALPVTSAGDIMKALMFTN